MAHDKKRGCQSCFYRGASKNNSKTLEFLAEEGPCPEESTQKNRHFSHLSLQTSNDWTAGFTGPVISQFYPINLDILD